MIKIGITGQAGFAGTNLFNTLGLEPAAFERIAFEDAVFADGKALRSFVGQCDVIVHLAAMNRDPDPAKIYETNVRLVRELIRAMEAENVTPHVLFSSSTQEELDNEYGRSKSEGRRLFEEWAARNGASFTGLIIPNVFGPFCRPDYNSFVSTFCHKLTHNDTPQIINDSQVKLIYVGNLSKRIIQKINEVRQAKEPVVEKYNVPWDFEKKVSDILGLLSGYKELYFDKGYIPALKDADERNLFVTFCSYIDLGEYFPRKLELHTDERGTFVETIKLGMGGQVSFSTTKPGITRGNHFHTRKIERFTVIKGKASIRLRKTGTDKVFEFLLDGDEPSYVDMPVWFTHNITNIGEEELYTQFWINEWYDPGDGDTWFENVETEEK